MGKDFRSQNKTELSPREAESRCFPDLIVQFGRSSMKCRKEDKELREKGVKEGRAFE